LEDGGVETLAERLGVGARHLRRLFLRHLGATPSAIARTQRLHFAKKLIDETSLPMSQIAIASGFGCVRRFNAAIRATFQRTPTHIRKIARQKEQLPDDQYLFRLGFRPPFDWQGMLRFLAPRAIPGVEIVENGVYRRTIFLNGEAGFFEVSLDRTGLALEVRIQFGDSRALFLIVERIRRMFDLNADWQVIAERLRMDEALVTRVEASPGLRVPGCWDGFELAVRAILGQQVTVKGASTLAGRLVAALGRPFSVAGRLTHLFPQPELLAEAQLNGIGLTAARMETIRGLARSVCQGKIAFEGIVDTEEFLTRLCEIPGIGKWTAQYVAMRALGEPDALPTGDLGLAHALGLKSAREIEERSQAWRPWRAYAAMYLWNVRPARVKTKGRRFVESQQSLPSQERAYEKRMKVAV
jgi:AraC family transcriptional regulator, regulatory protein of adaptative response / DNA-3-methyladenine glycosylase II